MELDSLKKSALVRIVDDDAAHRKSLMFLLETEGWQVASYENASRFRNLDNFEVPGCILLDISMPSESGLELHDYLSENGCILPIVFVSGHGDIDVAVSSLKKGAVDFIPKPYKPARLLQAVESAVRKDVLDRRSLQNDFEMKKLFDSLTAKEKLVLRHVLSGRLNKQIAFDLNISEKTVQAHRSAALHKLRVRNSADAVRYLKFFDEN